MKSENKFNQRQQQPRKQGIYLGDRNKLFKSHIESLLKKGNIEAKYIEFLTTPACLQAYGDAYTSETVDATNNYQFYEHIGDGIGASILVKYAYKRFPQLRCSKGVKVGARIRIVYASKAVFQGVAEKLGMWPFISASIELRSQKKEDLLEDVFEAVTGVTQLLLDEEYDIGVGYACVYKLLSAIFDDLDISLKYEDLFDAKTRLKELFDMKGEELGQLKYKSERQQGAQGENNSVAMAIRCRDGQEHTISIGRGPTQDVAQQQAATNALANLAKQGHYKKAPSIYAKFANPDEQEKETTKADILNIIGTEDKINEQFFTEGKPKFKPMYTSTALIKYCRERDYPAIKLCLEMGASPNIADLDGLTATDLLLIGRKNTTLVRKTLKRFLKVVDKVYVHKNIYDTYIGMYTHSFFSKSEAEGKFNKIEW